jgi:hypothetical protein
VHINILKPGKVREQMHEIPPGPSGNRHARRNSSGFQRVLRSLARQEDTKDFLDGNPMALAPGIAPAELAPARAHGPVAQDNIPEIPLVPIPDVPDEEEDVEPEDEELDTDDENENEAQPDNPLVEA